MSEEKEEKLLFTAMFTRYDRMQPTIFDNVSHYRDVRTRGGCIVKKSMSLPPDITSKIVGFLTQGEVISFLADVELINIEFKYPHALSTKLKN